MSKEIPSPAPASAPDGGDFGSFWHGPLNPFAYACLASFGRIGVPLRVYSYDPRLDLPPGVGLEDARSICTDESLVRRFIANGKPSIATFADMFRYKMIQATGRCWVDADLVCLARPPFGSDEHIYCRQADAVGSTLINNAVLRLPASHKALAELVATTQSAVDVDQSWGALGPFLLTRVLTKYGLVSRALDSRACYPIEPEQFWKPFLPAYCDRVAEAASGASFLHLWSEAIAWSGYDVGTCPPPGSYLYDAFRRAGALGRFRRVCDEKEVLGVMARQLAQSERPAGSSSGRA